MIARCCSTSLRSVQKCMPCPVLLASRSTTMQTRRAAHNQRVLALQLISKPSKCDGRPCKRHRALQHVLNCSIATVMWSFANLPTTPLACQAYRAGLSALGDRHVDNMCNAPKQHTRAAIRGFSSPLPAHLPASNALPTLALQKAAHHVVRGLAGNMMHIC